MLIATVKYIAALPGVSPATVRRLVDKGYVDANRNYCGWRVFVDPDKAVAKIKVLMSGRANKEFQEKTPDSIVCASESGV